MSQTAQGPDSRLSIHLLRKTRPTSGQCIAALDGMEISVPKLSWRFLRLNRFALKKAVGVHVSKPGASLCVSVTFPSAKTAKQVLRSLAG